MNGTFAYFELTWCCFRKVDLLKFMLRLKAFRATRTIGTGIILEIRCILFMLSLHRPSKDIYWN